MAGGALLLAGGAGGPPAATAAAAAQAAVQGGAASQNKVLADLIAAAKPSWPAATSVAFPDYSQPGPFIPARLPPLEHTCEPGGCLAARHLPARGAA